MDSIKVERLDHHGIVAGIINELKIVEIIDAQIEADEQEEITTGEAIKAMIINGLGFPMCQPSPIQSLDEITYISGS